MYKKATEILNIFHDNGYLAYIVGGYPRDTLLGIKTNDIDICTNALPGDIMRIFNIDNKNDIKYGSIKVMYKDFSFDITTFRKDVMYKNNRKPSKIIYVDDLETDLYRRDFTINTICIDKDNNYIDILNGMNDVNNKIIRTVGNPKIKLKEDVLRILRAIRFAVYLDFNIEEETLKYIIKYGYLLSNLSGSRRREELDKIFLSKDRDRARKMIVQYGLDRFLGIKNLNDIVLCDSVLGIWSQLELSIDYPFTKLEKEYIKKIREMLELGINNYTVYKYGIDISLIVASIMGVNDKIIYDIYNNLVIYSKSNIKIKSVDISCILDKKPDKYLGEIFNDIEIKIVNGELENKYECICEYIKQNY